MPVPRTIRVLILSRDVSRLSSRTNLLTQAGYSADWEMDQDRALRRIGSNHYQLVILGDSLTQDEQFGLRARVKQTKPDVAVLDLTDAEDKAEPFLEAVKTALQQSEEIPPSLALMCTGGVREL